MQRLGEFSILDGRRFLSLGVASQLRYAYLSTYLPLRVLTAIMGARFVHHGIGSTVFPQGWLVAETTAAITRIVDSYLSGYADEFKALPSLNLDTGADNSDYPLHQRAVTELGRRRAQLLS
jgi:hypothetical protein